MTQDSALAETMAGLVLWMTGVGSTYFGAEVAAAVCFGMVGAIACARSYKKTHE